MKKQLIYGCYLALFGILISCSGTSNSTDEGTVVVEKLSNEGSYEAEIRELDKKVALGGELLSSFRYTKENGAMILVHAHLSKQGKIIKIDEEYADGDNGNYGLNSYYFKGDSVFATRAYYEDTENQVNPGFVERYSYYADNGKVVKTIERRSPQEEGIESAEFKPTVLTALRADRARKVLNQEGEFRTFFQGFVEVQALRYIILGEEDDAGYTTTVRVDQPDGFVAFLIANQRACLNKEVQVAFKNVVDQTGFEYQSYVQGVFKK